MPYKCTLCKSIGKSDVKDVHCQDSQQIPYIILRNQVTMLAENSSGVWITVVTKQYGLFIREKRLLFYRKGYDRSEKRHGAQGKGHAPAPF